MENNDVFKCSHYGCGNSFIRKNIPLDVKSPINDEDKLELMIDGILITNLFCVDCSITHAIITCSNSKISIEHNRIIQRKKGVN